MEITNCRDTDIASDISEFINEVYYQTHGSFTTLKRTYLQYVEEIIKTGNAYIGCLK